MSSWQPKCPNLPRFVNRTFRTPLTVAIDSLVADLLRSSTSQSRSGKETFAKKPVLVLRVALERDSSSVGDSIERRTLQYKRIVVFWIEIRLPVVRRGGRRNRTTKPLSDRLKKAGRARIDHVLVLVSTIQGSKRRG
jgi:hypothetical protein